MKKPSSVAPITIAPRPNAQIPSQLGTSNLKSLNTQYLHSSRAMVDASDPNDDSIIDLQYEKNQSKIDYNKMRESVKEKHAAKPNGTTYTCGEACWSANPGRHHCVKSSEKTDLTKFGVGIILYFKFIKHFMLFFFLFMVLSIPAYIFYASSFATYNQDSDGSVTYIDLLTATTVGAVGFGSTSCGIAKYSDGSSTTSENQIYFQCPTSTIASVDTLIYGLVDTGTTCSFVDTNDLSTSCNSYDTTTLTSTFSSCTGQASCSITIPKELFLQNDATCTSLYASQNIYMKISCQATDILVFNKYSVSKSTVAYIVAGCDAAIIIIFLVMIYTLKYAQKSATENVQKRAYSASSYTVELKNLPQTMPAEELAAKLWSFLDSKLGAKSVQSGHRVVDVQIVLPNKLIEYSKQVGNIIHTKNGLIRDFIQDYVPGFTRPTIDFKGLQEVMKTLIAQNHPKLREANKVFNKIKVLATKKMRLMAEIQRLKTTRQARIVSAFVTFSSIPARNRILDTFVSSPIDRIARVFCSCYYEKDISFYGKILRARTSADPGSILWENLGEPGPKVFVRRAISTLLTVALWVISGAILILSTYYKNNFKKSFPTIDCSSVSSPTITTAETDYLLGDYQKGLLECYCEADIIDRLNQVFPTTGKTLCLTWFTDKVLETSITFAIVFAVLIINYFVQFVFQGLSQFEKHSTLNKQLAQRVIKTFVAQFLNTGLMILIVNAKIDISFWQGKFRDITPLWYENVGSTLLSTMFINIVTVPAVKLALALLKKMARCYDRRCGSDERVTRKKTQSAYESVYFGPEFIIDFRYSQVLTLTFVCFLYSGGMPLLYLTSFLQLLFTYFFDKIFLLKICILPKNYDENLESVVRPTLYISLVAHLIFAIFMFGNNEIFNQDVTLFKSVVSTVDSISSNITDNSKNIVSKFFTRTVYDYNVVLTIVLIIIIALVIVKGVLLGLLRRTIFAIFTKDEEKTQKKGAKVAPMTLANYTFFYVIKTEDIAKLIQLTKVTIKSTQNPELVAQLKSKLQLLKHEYRIKTQGPTAAVNFIGFYTYDVRLQPKYAAEFAIEEMLDDETLD